MSGNHIPFGNCLCVSRLNGWKPVYPADLGVLCKQSTLSGDYVQSCASSCILVIAIVYLVDFVDELSLF